MDEREGRKRQRLEAADRPEELPERLRPVVARVHQPLEEVHVDAPGEDLALPAPDCAADVIGSLELVEALHEPREHVIVEQVQRRAVENDRGNGAVAFEADPASAFSHRGSDPRPARSPRARLRGAPTAASGDRRRSGG